MDHIEQQDPQWRVICRLGGVAAFAAAILFRRNLAEEFLLLRSLGVIHSGPQVFPRDAGEWFVLLHTHPVIGLTFLNLFDTVNYALVGLIFLGLYSPLRKVSAAWMTLALATALVAITAYFASNQAFALLSLSNRYASAAGDPQRLTLLAAGEALLAIHNSAANYGPGLYPSFLLINVAGLIIAIVMLRSREFSKATAWSGILANLFGLGYYVTLTIDPSLNALPLSVAAPFLLVWYLLIGSRLLRIAAAS